MALPWAFPPLPTRRPQVASLSSCPLSHCILFSAAQPCDSVLYSLNLFPVTNFLPRRREVPHFPINVLSGQHPLHPWPSLSSASVGHSLKDPSRIGHSHGYILTDLCCGRSPDLLSETTGPPDHTSAYRSRQSWPSCFHSA